MPSPSVPDHLHRPLDAFADDFERVVSIGESTWHEAQVAFVGLARNCAPWLSQNLVRLEHLADRCNGWKLHIETNDNDDDTDQVLIDFCRQHPQATFTSQRLGRQQLSAEFAGPRTQALAEYRTACQQWVRDNAQPVDFVVVVDFDSWGGWSHAGFLHGVGALTLSHDGYGMASVSLIEHSVTVQHADGSLHPGKGWVHYDAWALRLNSTWDDYTAGHGGWKHQWLPAIGSSPVPVVSAFGGMAIYDTHAYLKGTYDGRDCEHVAFHESAARRTGMKMYLDPAMRTVMHWMPDGGQHGNH